MKIAVCIKQVPNVSDIDIDEKGHICRAGVVSVFNEDDRHALEEALKIKDALGFTVVAISMGPMHAETILREAMAYGADEAILISDRRLAGADTYATARALSCAVRKIEADIVFTGRQASDGDTAQVGPSIAEFLNFPQVTYVEKIEIENENTFVVTRETEDGMQKVRLSSPCLFTVLSGYNKVRYMGAGYSKDITFWNIDDLGITEEQAGIKGSPTRVYKTYTNKTRTKCEVIETSAEEASDIIYSELIKHMVIKD